MNPDFSDFLEIVNSEEFQAFQEDFRNKHHPANNWNWKNPEKLKVFRKNYEKTVKGKEAILRKQKKRRERMKIAQIETDLYEKELIKEFYLNCPEGYEVDHIHPIAHGGKHRLSNLQYLTPKENRTKAYRKYYKKKGP